MISSQQKETLKNSHAYSFSYGWQWENLLCGFSVNYHQSDGIFPQVSAYYNPHHIPVPFLLPQPSAQQRGSVSNSKKRKRRKGKNGKGFWNFCPDFLNHRCADGSFILYRWCWGVPTWLDSDDFGLQGNGRRVFGRRRVRDGLRDQPEDLSNEAVHQLRCAEEEQCSLLQTRRLVLQLQARSSGQPLLSRVQCYYPMPTLVCLLVCSFSILFDFTFMGLSLILIGGWKRE